MGTWGPGPFDNDAADELLEEVAELAERERAPYLKQILVDGALIGMEDVDVFPDDVIAAATLVAMSVPHGLSRLGDEEDREHAAGSVLADVDRALASAALTALRKMFEPGNHWYDTWVDDEPDGLAAQSARAAAQVLTEFLAGGDAS
ncbi:DUF4259 domain-containing protein [Actinoplanes solisilvae]|uniref:DUF4259 domain-containing protein n=1 Tax=Actinoplanes solisilvae TaxID=2486853 RepID=UPI000FD9531A|nr:DUF4259 domain-containing protein [Actinoplanes solisilvae]